MNLLPNYSAEQVQSYMNSYDFKKISLSIRDYDNNHISEIDVNCSDFNNLIEISGISIDLNLNKIETKNNNKQPFYINICLREPKSFIRDSSGLNLNYKIINNKISILLRLNYGYYFYIDDIMYFAMSKYNFYKKYENSSILNLEDENEIFNSNEFYSFEELLKIINNSVFL